MLLLLTFVVYICRRYVYIIYKKKEKSAIYLLKTVSCQLIVSLSIENAQKNL